MDTKNSKGKNILARTRAKAPVKIIGERNIELNLSNPDHHEKIASICKALSSPLRLQMLDLLKSATLSIQEISRILDLPISSTALHIKTLEQARLVITETQPGLHGSMRVCVGSLQTFRLETFDSAVDSVDNTIRLELPVGHYSDCQVSPTCGLADENGAIDTYDNPLSFYSPQRMNAQLLWFEQGFVEYRFSNLANPRLPLHEILFRMELCSEAPGFLEDWPSDITIAVNDIEILTYRAPGDFGARRGILTPNTWVNGRTQYGLLKTFSVRADGSYLDGKKINSEINLSQLKLMERPYISLRVAVKEDAIKKGGINLFGEKYGDYEQGIVMELVY